jgi:uncharacterized protein (TIGR03083 family)
MTALDIDLVSRVGRGAEADALARGAYDALIADLSALDSVDWSAQTVCDAWDVEDMVRHVVGAAKSNASVLEMARQQAVGFRRKRAFDGNALDATNAFQVEQHRDLGPEALLAELRRVAPAAVRARMRKPRVLDRVRIPLDAGGSTAAGAPTHLSFGDLFRITYTRDTWLHRIDIARAVGREPIVTSDVDGRIVEDVVKEWADLHGASFDLTLTGIAGGRWARPGGGPAMELDAVEFCWILSGRGAPAPGAPGADLLGHRLIF